MRKTPNPCLFSTPARGATSGIEFPELRTQTSQSQRTRLLSGPKIRPHQGIPWWSSCQDSTFSLMAKGPVVQSLGGELRSHKPHSTVKTNVPIAERLTQISPEGSPGDIPQPKPRLKVDCPLGPRANPALLPLCKQPRWEIGPIACLSHLHPQGQSETLAPTEGSEFLRTFSPPQGV